MKKLLFFILVLVFAEKSNALGGEIKNNIERKNSIANTHVACSAEEAYALGLVSYASENLAEAEKYFVQALALSPKMTKAGQALRQVRIERTLGN